MVVIVDQWRSFENDIQDLRRVTATRLSIQTSQEIETTIREFLSQFTTTNGVEAPSAPEIPTIPVLETRASIMMLLISLVRLTISTLTVREKQIHWGTRKEYGL